MWSEGRTPRFGSSSRLRRLAKETALITPAGFARWELVCPCSESPRFRASAFALATDMPWQSFAMAGLRRPTGLLACLSSARNRIFLRQSRVPALQRERHAQPAALRAGAADSALADAGLSQPLRAYPRRSLRDVSSAAARRDGTGREPIAINAQLVLAVAILADFVAFSIARRSDAGAISATGYPLVILVCVSTLRRRLHRWTWWIAAACAALCIQPCYSAAVSGFARRYAALSRLRCFA